MIWRLSAILSLLGLAVLASSPVFGQSVAIAQPLQAPINPALVASLEARLQQLEGEIRRLNGVVEQNSFVTTTLRNQLEKQQSDSDFRISQLEQQLATAQQQLAQPQVGYVMPQQPQMPIAPQTPQFTPPTPTTSGLGTPFQTDNASGLYNQAFQMIQSGNYDGAQQQFSSFLQSYPQHKLAGNAKYWLGETFYVRGFYEQAAQHFAEGYQTYPQGSKAADNLLKLSLTLSALNRNEDACITLSQLAADYPQAPEAITSRADKERSRLGCS